MMAKTKKTKEAAQEKEESQEEAAQEEEQTSEEEDQAGKRIVAWHSGTLNQGTNAKKVMNIDHKDTKTYDAQMNQTRMVEMEYDLQDAKMFVMHK
jgi:hypothetical protein